MACVKEDGGKRHVAQEHAYIQRGLYARQLREILSVFPKQQVHVILQDELQNRPNEILDGIAAFLNIRPFGGVQRMAVHERAYAEALGEERIEEVRAYFRDDVAELEQLLGRDLSGWK